MTGPHPHRFPGVTFAAIADELGREHAARMNAFARAVAKGNMTRVDAERELALIEAIAADCDRFAAAHRALPLTRETIGAPAHRFSWADRRACLLRALDSRARLYPRQIARGELAQADADRRNACIAAMLMLYEDGLDWAAPAGMPPEAKADFWRGITAEIAARKTPPQQEIAL